MQETSIVDQWLVIDRHKWHVLTVVVSSIVTAIIMSLVISPVYEATVVFYPPLESPEASFIAKNSESTVSREVLVPLSSDEKSAPYIGILKSKLIAQRVSSEYPEVTVDELLRSNMDFEITTEYLIKLYGRANDPNLAADIANAYFYHLNLMLNEASIRQVESSETMLSVQLKSTEEELNEARMEQISFEKQNNVASIEEAISSQYETHTMLQSRINTSMVKLTEVNSRLKATRREFKNEEGVLLKSTGAVSTPLIEHLRVQLSEVVEKLTTASLELGPKHVDVKALNNQRDEIERMLDEALKSAIGGEVKPDSVFSESLRQSFLSLLIEKDAINGELKALEAALEDSRLKLNKIPELKTKSEDLEAKVGRLLSEATQIRKNLREMELQKSRSIEHLVLVDEATPPARPAFPRMIINIVVALLVGTMGGLFYAFLMDYIRRETAKSARELALDIRRGVRFSNEQK